ncbi:MAG: hypothetical protein DCF17_09240 [Shackletoniella antarctica]|uniref:Uncharacterized protein n=1 Tax=Shackletoniella antarctica TaxID=268115 RepID=A0A2W4WB21_9CYAN|nr:MAG: hypothetical protein DCF17_09240 [Shackletoniella antarctica]
MTEAKKLSVRFSALTASQAFANIKMEATNMIMKQKRIREKLSPKPIPLSWFVRTGLIATGLARITFYFEVILLNHSIQIHVR